MQLNKKGLYESMICIQINHIHLTLLHSERPKLHTILAFLSAIELIYVQENMWILRWMCTPPCFSVILQRQIFFVTSHLPPWNISVLQIRRGKQNNLRIIFHILQNIFCDPSLEPSHRDGSKEGS